MAAPASLIVTALLSFSCELRAELGPVMPPARYQASIHALAQSRCGALVVRLIGGNLPPPFGNIAGVRRFADTISCVSASNADHGEIWHLVRP